MYDNNERIRKTITFAIMCEVIVKIKCPHCSSLEVVKNGKKANGNQNFKCKSCKKQFQKDYFYNYADPKNKKKSEIC